MRGLQKFEQENRSRPSPNTAYTGNVGLLGRSQWFSVLDQRKACHQGFADRQSQAMTAFISPWGLYEWIKIPD